MDVDQAKDNPAVQMIDALQRVLKKGQLLDGGTGLWKRKPEWSRLFQSFSADYHLFRRLANETCFQSDDGPSKKVTSIMSKLKVRKCLPCQKLWHSQSTFVSEWLQVRRSNPSSIIGGSDFRGYWHNVTYGGIRPLLSLKESWSTSQAKNWEQWIIMSTRYLTFMVGLLKFESNSLIFTSSIIFRRVLVVSL